MNGKYIIASIIPRNGKHNFYHDEMRGSIATIVSAEVGDGAVIRYIPGYDGLPHYVTTSTVSSIEEKDGAVFIETNNTSYIFQAVTEAWFTSVWDGGFSVTTGCKVNLATNEVFDIEVSEETADMVNTLDEEYITINGENYPVVSNEYMESDPEEEGSYWYKK